MPMSNREPRGATAVALGSYVTSTAMVLNTHVFDTVFPCIPYDTDNAGETSIQEAYRRPMNRFVSKSPQLLFPMHFKDIQIRPQQ